MIDSPASGRRLLARRAGAYLVDIVLLFAVLAPAGWLVQRALGIPPPTSGPEVWHRILLNFSLPTWIYFASSDASAGGATFGKRWLGIRVGLPQGERVPLLTALLRTAVKLLPWELVHIAAFAAGNDLSAMTKSQIAGIAGADLLAGVYLFVAAVTGGRRSVHDFASGTVVTPK